MAGEGLLPICLLHLEESEDVDIIPSHTPDGQENLTKAIKEPKSTPYPSLKERLLVPTLFLLHPRRCAVDEAKAMEGASCGPGAEKLGLLPAEYQPHHRRCKRAPDGQVSLQPPGKRHSHTLRGHVNWGTLSERKFSHQRFLFSILIILSYFFVFFSNLHPS